MRGDDGGYSPDTHQKIAGNCNLGDILLGFLTKKCSDYNWRGTND